MTMYMYFRKKFMKLKFSEDLRWSMCTCSNELQNN